MSSYQKLCREQSVSNNRAFFLKVTSEFLNVALLYFLPKRSPQNCWVGTCHAVWTSCLEQQRTECKCNVLTAQQVIIQKFDTACWLVRHGLKSQHQILHQLSYSVLLTTQKIRTLHLPAFKRSFTSYYHDSVDNIQDSLSQSTEIYSTFILTHLLTNCGSVTIPRLFF